MAPKEIVIVAAASENEVIGYHDAIPWNKIPEDLERFKEMTQGNPIIMGRKTLESMGKTLPGRKNIVLTHRPLSLEHLPYAGFALPAASIDEAMDRYVLSADTLFVIGGQSVYEQFMPLAGRIELTRVHRKAQGDTFFPRIDENSWIPAKKIMGPNYSFFTFYKK